MHKTNAGEKRTGLKAEALELTKDAKAAMNAGKTWRRPERRPAPWKVRQTSLWPKLGLEESSPSGGSTPIWMMKKTKATKKSSKTYSYWLAPGERAKESEICI